MRYATIQLQRLSACIECYQQELGVEHTLGHGIYNNPYHVNVLLSQLTRNIGALYPQIRNEIIIAFDDILDLSSNGKHLAFSRARES